MLRLRRFKTLCIVGVMQKYIYMYKRIYIQFINLIRFFRQLHAYIICTLSNSHFRDIVLKVQMYQ